MSRLMYSMANAVMRWMEVGHGGVDKALVPLYTKLIQEEFKELSAEFESGTEADQFKEALDLIWVILGYCAAKGWPVDEGWLELCASNFSKFTVGEEGKLVATKRADGKIQKPLTYVEADMQRVLNNHKGV